LISTRGKPAKWQLSRNRRLVLGRFHDCRNRRIAARTFAAAEIHFAAVGECIAVIAVGPGVGCGRMAGNEMVNCKRVLDRAQTVLQRMQCTHMSPPVAYSAPY
jgi:hypothetical protein